MSDQSLVHYVLEGIPDQHKLSAYIVMPDALRQLIELHNEYVIDSHGGHKLITNESTGLDLKKSLTTLAPEKQILILYNYLFFSEQSEVDEDDTKNKDTEEADNVEDSTLTPEERQLKVYIVKAIVATFSIIVCMFSGIVIYQYIQGGHEKETVMGAITATFSEILKFIFGIK